MEHSEAVRITNNGLGAIVSELRRLDAERIRLQEIADRREQTITSLISDDLRNAAPDLLASIIEFVQCNDGEHTIEMYQRARAAIAKSEGK